MWWTLWLFWRKLTTSFVTWGCFFFSIKMVFIILKKVQFRWLFTFTKCVCCYLCCCQKINCHQRVWSHCGLQSLSFHWTVNVFLYHHLDLSCLSRYWLRLHCDRVPAEYLLHRDPGLGPLLSVPGTFGNKKLWCNKKSPVSFMCFSLISITNEQHCRDRGTRIRSHTALIIILKYSSTV